jgi:hypothetical protein
VSSWKIRSPLDLIAYVFGLIILLAALNTRGPIVGALIFAVIATGGGLIGLRTLRSVWVSIMRDPPKR